MEQILPTYTIKQSEIKAYYTVDGGLTTEAFDTQADGALQTGIAKYWDPHYLATVIIAIDRDQTETRVTSWNDLSKIEEEVAFSKTPGNDQMLIAAMSYGLEGEDYTLEKAIKLLATLHKNSRLNMDTFNSPIIICYDYQATALIEDGRNIEIIVPKEGTFTYEKGLLSNENLVFEENVDKLLFESKFRLLDGQSDLSVYPDKEAYLPAVRVKDYEHFAKITQNVSPLIQREVLNSKRFMSINFRENLFSALIYMTLVTIWVSWILRRSMQKEISYAAFFTGIILNMWALVRLIKYQVVVNESLSRYLWYSYYIFQLSLPLVVLWMAWAIDNPKNEIFPPKWLKKMLVLIGVLIILVFTNDIHGFVFKLDLNKPDWAINYTYGFGYYIVLFVCMMNIAIAFAILLKKSIKSPRKKRFIFPLGVFAIFGIYNYKYIIREPFVYETDLTIVTGVFVLLMFESCIRSGLIPVNTKYIDIFTRSPLKMQIINKESEVAISSFSAALINKDIIERVIASSPVPVLQDDESLLFANPIPGGYAFWNEDITKIQELHREIQQSNEKLTEANIILAEEEKIKRSIIEKKEKKHLMEQLEVEIAENIEKLTKRIEKLEHSENHLIETNGIALLLCYIKRRCNLFFKEKETTISDTTELIIYIEELSEIAKYSNVQIVTVNQIKERIPVRYATLFYDFFYTLTELAVQEHCPYIIVELAIENEWTTMRLLPSVDIGLLKTESKLTDAISMAKGKIVRKSIEDTFGISISFPKGGVEND
ncbi:MAG: histidine kinase N-terminal 7TM domain-containing protein [Gudongella sp.]|nr:histidine kinase N-terminal 7TM domain-containing protein [Gudongella sp.]